MLDKTMQKFRMALDHIYGDRLERVILYGSRACGDARADSDYDVAVFLRHYSSFWQESRHIAEIETDILYEMGSVINALPFQAGAYENSTPLMLEIRQDGKDL